MNRQIAVEDSNYVIIFDPLCTGHVILRMRSGSQCIPMGDVMNHNSRTEKPRTFKLGGGVDHVARYRQSLIEVKRSTVKVTSQGHKAENGLMVKLLS